MSILQRIFITFLLPSLIAAAAGNSHAGPSGIESYRRGEYTEKPVCAPGPTILGGDIPALKQKVLRTISDLIQIRQQNIDTINKLIARDSSPELVNVREQHRECIRRYRDTFEAVKTSPSPQLYPLRALYITLSSELERLRNDHM